MQQKTIWQIIPLILTLGLGMFGLAHPAQAQDPLDCNADVCTQAFELKAGWTAIFLEVAPDPREIKVLFQGLPVDSVWTWNPKISSIEFIQNPSEDLVKQPAWLRYFPDSRPEAFLTNLFILQANRAYLVKMSAAATLTVTGQPALPKINWVPNSFNFVGFHVDESPPTFETFFAPSEAHAGQAIYQLNDDGNAWEWVDATITPIQSGEAYWVYCEGGSDYRGPLDIEISQGDRLDYGVSLDEQTIRTKNLTTSEKTVLLTVLSPAGQTPLVYRNFDPTAVERWPILPVSLSVAPDLDVRLRLGMQRDVIAPGTYAATLKIADDAGTRWLVPVNASAPELRGLWIGTVAIQKVGEVHSDSTTDPTTVAAEFQFRILIHVDKDERIRLLKEVIQMWQDGNNGEPGHFVLLTDDSLIPQYKGVSLQDGELVGRRISSVAYDFPGHYVDMNGSFGGMLSCNIVLEPDFPTNPFKHKYHPDHDNLSADYKLPTEEAYRITRKITLGFENPDGTELGAGYSILGGTYREEVMGLHKNPIIAEGKFSLILATVTDVLN
jgi:hypothetical protein